MATFQPWTMVLYGHLGSIEPLGGIDNAHNRVFTFQFNAPQTIEFNLDTTNPATKRILENREESLFVVLYYKGTLVLTTEITALQLIGSASTKSLQVTCTETMWTRLMPRLVGKTVAGYEVSGATDRITIIKNLVEALNAEGGGEDNLATGITPYSTTLGSTTTYPKVNFKPFQEVLEDIAFTAVGFDFWQVSTMAGAPHAYSDGNTGVIKYASTKGTTRTSSAIFEYGYGTRANVREYTFNSDYTLLANSIYVLPSGYPTTNFSSPVNVASAASEKLYGYREAVTSLSLSNKELAEKFAEDSIKFRRGPRQQFTFQPIPGAPNVPEFKPAEAAAGVYEVGDIITGRVKDNGITILNAAVRVYANVISVDDSGTATETLTLTMGG